MKLRYALGATPLDPNEIEGLIPQLSTQGELNEFEEESIFHAREWAINRRNRRLRDTLITLDGLKLLHQKMFDGVWKWAGKFRQTEKNIGVAPHQIQVQLSNLCEDVRYQIEHSVFSLDECAVRFHHRLTVIHPFSNGNGRHARLAADLLLIFRNVAPLTWGGTARLVGDELRKAYIEALREADRGEFGALVKFARL